MKVLIAVDPSEIAEKAFEWYFENCHKTENEVHICHEMEQPMLPNTTYTIMGPYFPAEEIKDILHEHQKQWKALQDHYKRKCEKIENLQFKIHFEQTNQKSGTGIVKMAESLGVNMIVMGTRGQGALRRTILGSVSDYVLHHAKVPVAIIPLPHSDDK